MLNTYVYHHLPPTCFGLCYTIFREIFALVPQKLYAFCYVYCTLYRNITKTCRFLASHACRIARKLLSNKQFSGKAQTGRQIGEFNPICGKYLILCALVIAIRWYPEKIIFYKNDNSFLKSFKLQAPRFLYIGQAFRYPPENAFYIFNQQIYFII